MVPFLINLSKSRALSLFTLNRLLIARRRQAIAVGLNDLATTSLPRHRT